MSTNPSSQIPEKEGSMFGEQVQSSPNSAIHRKRIFIFLAITFGLALAPYLVIYLSGGRLDSLLEPPSVDIFLIALMFGPTIANIATRLITREGWSNTLLGINLRENRWRYYLAAWFLPPAAAIVGATLYYLLFPGHFDPSMTSFRQQGLTELGNEMESVGFFLTQLAKGIVQPIWVMTLFYSLCEEFGWRAYLLPKLVVFGPRKAVLLVGLIHSIWHWPSILIIGFNYGFDYWGAPLTGPLAFTIVVIFQSALYAWVTLRSGSVWPAALCHSAINIWNTLAWIFISGEPEHLIGPAFQGMIGMLGYVGLGLLLYFNPRSFVKSTSSAVQIPFSSQSTAAKQAVD